MHEIGKADETLSPGLLHRLSSSFILGYHGCDLDVSERLLSGSPFKISNNEYDWLGPGIYFREANPQRGFEFAREASEENAQVMAAESRLDGWVPPLFGAASGGPCASGRRGSGISKPFVTGAVVELGLCLDLTTSDGLEWVRIAYESLVDVTQAAASEFPAKTS